MSVTSLNLASSKGFRYVFVFIACLIAGLLFYIYAWRVFQQEVGLPPGVVERDPKVNTKLLQGINDARVQRGNHQVYSYGIHNPLFGIEVPPQVTPDPLASPTPLISVSPTPSVAPNLFITPTPEPSTSPTITPF